MLQGEEAKGSQAELRRGFTQPSTLMRMGVTITLLIMLMIMLIMLMIMISVIVDNEERDMSVATF